MMCPECGTGLLSGVCASCGWHPPGHTLLHANFARDPECRWCDPVESLPPFFDRVIDARRVSGEREGGDR